MKYSIDLLAKLLASENIQVRQDASMKTAAFDVKKRILFLPKWDNMTDETINMLVGHEIAHARWTPADGWDNAIKNKNHGKGFHSFVNVVEDARIESKVKSTFPGINKDFREGYKSLLEKDFFGDLSDLDSKLLVDRINIHFKLGQGITKAMDVVFKNDEERNFVSRIEKAFTFSDVVKIAEDLYEYCKEEMNGNESETDTHEDFSDDDGEDSEETTESDDKSETESGSEEDDTKNESGSGSEDDGEDSEEDGEDSEEDDTENESPTDNNGAGSSNDNDPESETDKKFQEALENAANNNDHEAISYIVLPKETDFNFNEFIVPFKKVHVELGGWAVDAADEYVTEEFKTYKSKDKMEVAHLVKEFEMRKNAEKMARAITRKSGVLDVNKMHSYKFNDDIFKRNTTVPGGKNHGLVFLLDWSGSFSSELKDTYLQITSLMDFCRKQQIEFVVYAFTDNYNRGYYYYEDSKILKDYDPNGLKLSQFNLLELFSSKMRAAEYKSALSNVMLLVNYHRNYRSSVPSGYNLGGTPLDQALVTMLGVIPKFKDENKLQKVSFVLCTDGASNSRGILTNDSKHIYDHGVKNFYDPVTRRQVEIAEFNNNATVELLKIVSSRVPEMCIEGFFIVESSKHSFSYAGYQLSKEDRNKIDSYWLEFKVKGSLRFEAPGYNNFYVMAPKSNTKDYVAELEDGAVTNRKIISSFKKNLKSNAGAKAILTTFIKSIA